MKQYDLVVIGGGIHGVGAAQAAAARGYSVLLLEQQELACGTSSRSSKLIHGGLRYLETAQFSLVHECLQERQILLRIAPELVRLQPFHIPIYQATSRRPWQLQFGLALYALLSGFDRAGRFQRLPRSEWAGLDGLSTDKLQTVFRYYDAQTDDALLTAAVMQSAIELGATLCCPATLSQVELTNNNVIVHYQQQNQAHSCITKCVVNAAGPWVNQILDKITPAPPRQPIDLVQGSHIIVPGQLQRGCYYMEAPQDRRAVFAMPWHDNILVGTTESQYQGNPAAVQPLATEQDYLLHTLAHYFPQYRKLTREQLIGAFAGLRVLPADDRNAFKRSRDTLLLGERPHQPRLITIYGGKLTAYRATADRVMARLRHSLPSRQAIADTKTLKLKVPNSGLPVYRLAD